MPWWKNDGFISKATKGWGILYLRNRIWDNKPSSSKAYKCWGIINIPKNQRRGVSLRRSQITWRPKGCEAEVLKQYLRVSKRNASISSVTTNLTVQKHLTAEVYRKYLRTRKRGVSFLYLVMFSHSYFLHPSIFSP